MGKAISVTELGELVQGYVGGQLEIQNENERYLYRGEVASIVVEGENINFVFKWIAEMEGFPPLPTGGWVNHANLDYKINVYVLYRAENIGPGRDGGGDRLSFQSALVGELAILFPPDGSKLDPSKVEGLTLAS